MKKISLKIYVVAMFLWIPLCVLMVFGARYPVSAILFFAALLVNIIMGILTTANLYRMKKRHPLSSLPPE